MSKNVYYARHFRKDFKLCIKRGYGMQQIKIIMKSLEGEKKLPKETKTTA